MKKILFIILCICMVITSHATTSDTYQFEYEEQGKTIIFDDNTTFTSEERQYIADVLVYGNSDTENSTTYAWCWLTGHDLSYESVIEIQHKVSATEPRCYKTTYKVETCSKCDHMETTTLGSTFIVCCPEE